MKYRFSLIIVLSLVLVSACGYSPALPSYRPILPELPPYWKEILGEAHWRLEWIGEEGNWREYTVSPGREAPGLSLIQEWTTPVLAWPFWPERDITPGMMRPSGGLFPWDVSGTKLCLSWEGGVAAFFWQELAAAERTSAASEGRLPWYFDWPRFRELLAGDSVSEAVRSDLWLADWEGIAAKTVQSGFDRRRIVSRSFTEISIAGLGGLWAGSSPFAPLLEAPPEGPLRLNAADVPETWVSADAVLKCSKSGWVVRHWF